MNGDGSDVGSRMTRSLADFVRDVGFAVADGQRRLDRHSLSTQREIDREAAEGDLPHAFEAPWYRFAEVDVDMQLHFDTVYERRQSRDGTTYYAPGVGVNHAGPRQSSDEHVDATSSVHFRLVPVPPNMPSGRAREDGDGDEVDGDDARDTAGKGAA
jgi:hypothetical protein